MMIEKCKILHSLLASYCAFIACDPAINGGTSAALFPPQDQVEVQASLQAIIDIYIGMTPILPSPAGPVPEAELDCRIEKLQTAVLRLGG